MPHIRWMFVVLLVAAPLSSASAQESPAEPAPSPEHQWLRQFEGKWTSTSKAIMAPDEPPVESTGSMTSRMLGNFWVVNDMKAHMQGHTVRGLQTIGYDPAKKKYVGTWVDSASHRLWQYEGTVDQSGKKLILEAQGPNILAQGKPAKYRDNYEFQTPDWIIATSEMQDDEGNWITFLKAELHREK